MNKIAVDTNVLVYIIDSSESNKHVKSKEILLASPIISSQVVSEFINVTRRILDKPKQEIILKCTEWMQYGQLTPVSFDTLYHAAQLIRKYNFQIFDAIIVASALESNCQILYSEDMQHGLMVENKLTIINPFVLQDTR